MKGISLSIETIVIVIVAVLVLIVIVIFFSGGFTPSSQSIVLRSQQNNLCSQYVNIAGDCETENKELNEDCDKGTCLLKDISKVCNSLGYNSCISGTAAGLFCIQQCCSNFCLETNACVADGRGKCIDAISDCSNGYKKDDHYVCGEGQECCIPS
ncbi:MAG: hypothetical protein NT129_06185 [Candidatus Aenigmarchaeota archaeon]|nr:hypothetical protein [Candidatus Aenigmarchaeota archaeon]